MKDTKKKHGKLLSIGQVSDIFGVHPDTLRNWEKRGIITPLRVGVRNDRRYRSQDLEKIMGEKSIAKELGLPKEEDEKMDLTQLKKFLWESADILRGMTDSGDYKKYIFGLLFFKRISDVWDEEYQNMIEEFKNEDLAKASHNHRFQLPDDCRWEIIQNKSTGIGQELNKIFRKIVQANSPRLDNVFDGVDFANPAMFSNEVLQKLVNHFSKHSFGNTYISSDLLGDAYEYLIGQFAADAGKKGGEFYTPREVERVIINILKPKVRDHIYDMTVGSGGFLLEAYNYIRSKKIREDDNPLYLYGQEMNISTYAIAKINMFLHGLDSADIQSGDTLTNPKFLNNDGSLKTFDICIANPPYSVSEWGYETFISEKFGRIKGYDAFPPKKNADFAFVLHMIASMKETGKAGIVLPHGVLFRSGGEKKIRKSIVEKDIIEAVIGLPKNLFFGTGISTVIIIFNKKKLKERKNKILFINAENDFQAGKNQNSLRKEDINKIVSTFEKYEEADGYSTVAAIEDIESKDFNLSVNVYVANMEEEEEIDVSEAWDNLRELEKKQAAADRKVAKFIKELKY